ncbi:MAG: DEAD/DEAH box helicase family protein [Pyrinomonadaceae bacterium]
MNKNQQNNQPFTLSALLKPRPANRHLRRWQEKALKRYAQAKQRRFLITGCPGSGKTALAREVSYALLSGELFRDKKIERVVVIVPTEHLKYQWAQSFHEAGIELDPNWSNSSYVETAGYHGVVVTYALR